VSQGLFGGLKLNRDTWWGKSDLGSQCLGLYEKEILDFISQRGPFDVFLDIGAADGYYGIGMLHSKKASHSICFEISEDGQRAIKENWALNNRPGRLDVYGEATNQSLEKIASELTRKSLVLIDIEGSEFSLLAPRVISVLRESTIIIEIHNWVSDFPSKYTALLKYLNQYFQINIINPTDRNTRNIPLLRSYTDDNRLLVASERRPCLMRFLHLEPKRE
jgi:predicted O-methyltransferase YrrM